MRPALFAALLLSAATCLPAADPPPNHLVLPASTPLHEVLLGRKADAFVAVNGGAEVDAKALAADLKPLGGEGKRAYFQIVLDDTGGPDALADELKQAAKEAGFEVAGHSRQYDTTYSWAEDTGAPRETLADGLAGDETGYGDALVKVYAVRTPLSLYLTDGATVVADVSPAGLDDLDRLQTSIAALLKEHEIEPKGRLRFLTRLRSADAPAPDSFVNEMRRLAKSLGFEESTTSISYK